MQFIGNVASENLRAGIPLAIFVPLEMRISCHVRRRALQIRNHRIASRDRCVVLAYGVFVDKIAAIRFSQVRLNRTIVIICCPFQAYQDGGKPRSYSLFERHLAAQIVLAM